MATLRAASGLSARVLRHTPSHNIVRALSTTSRAHAAQNFSMPALSPTMTEGNIATWRVGEGDTYSAGDVLLEIETDKATMDVEAQDDGVVVKIMQGDGAKGVQVGTRIAVLADAGDDPKSVAIPEDEGGAVSAVPAPETPEIPKETPPQKPASRSPPSGKRYPQKYPLMPSVASLVAQHGLDEAAVESITPTGPGGRLLKGDVLAHVGAIDAGRPAQLSALFEKLAKLDLSDIRLAKPKEKKEEPKKKTPAPPTAPQYETVAKEISLHDVSRLQQALQRRLRTDVPLSMLIQRAVAIANADLPAEPVARDAFDDILGLEPKVVAKKTPFTPVINAGGAVPKAQGAVRKPDIIDILTGRGMAAPKPAPTPTTTADSSVFELKVKPGQVKRANAFLSRLEDVLTKEPGSLLVTQ